MQRDVEIDIETTDKQGGFIGNLYVNRENVAKLLLEEGLASVHGYSAEQSGNANELYAAEEKAKVAKRGMWHDYDPSQNADISSLTVYDPTSAEANGTTSNGTAAPQKKDYRDITVTFIDPETLHLKLQLISPSHSGALGPLMSAFKAYHASPSSVKTLSSLPPKTGDLVSARYSADGEWYRARVRRNDRDAKKSDVFFVDYGNTETVGWNELRPVGDAARFGLGKLKAQSIDAGLSFCQFATTNPEYRADAVAFLTDLTANRPLVASLDFEEKDSGSWWVTLFDPERADNNKEGGEEESLNADVVAEGLAMLQRKPRAWEASRPKVMQHIRKKEDEAKAEKKGMWEYGDISED